MTALGQIRDSVATHHRGHGETSVDASSFWMLTSSQGALQGEVDCPVLGAASCLGDMETRLSPDGRSVVGSSHGKTRLRSPHKRW